MTRIYIERLGLNTKAEQKNQNSYEPSMKRADAVAEIGKSYYSASKDKEPAGGSWSDDVRRLFPEFLWGKAFAGNPQPFGSHESIADRYFTNPMSNRGMIRS